MLKLIHNRGRGVKAPVLLAPSNLLLRFAHASRGYVVPIAGVVAAAVAVVSLLTWLAPNSDKPIRIEAVDRVLPGVLEQVDDQVASLLGVGKETVLQNVREGLVAAGSRLGGIASASSMLPSPVTLSTSSAATPTPEESSQTTNEELPLQPPREPSPSGTSKTSLPATQAPPPTTSEPPPTTEEPPPAVEVPPPTEEPKPPTTEEPPPTTEEPPPATEMPPPAAGNPPPVTPPATDEPLPPPTDVH